MKKVMVASLLSAFAGLCLAAGTPVAFAQAPAAPAAGQVQLSPDEYKVYTNAITQPTPQTKAPALEQYLTTYPQSPVKADVLQQLMAAYSAFDPAKTIDAADRILQLDPTDLRALIFEVYIRGSQAAQLTDPAAKQAGLDAAASFAQKGLAAEGTKPKSLSDADFATLKAKATPIFYSAIGAAALNKKDTAGAIAAYTSELKAMPIEQTTVPGPVLQDTFYLGQAYYTSTPPDYINCTFYATRAAAYAPDNFKAQLQPLATYCYKKYHGNTDGYDAVVAAAKANLTPPAGFTITPAPKPSDIAHTALQGADIATMALGDKEFILANGVPDDAAKVWDAVKDKSVEIPDALVIESSPTVIKVAVSDDAVQSKTADFTFNMKPDEDAEKRLTPAQAAAKKRKDAAIAAATAVGQKVTLTGTYSSYTPNPIMIIMSDGEVVLPKAAAPVHHTTRR
jgi:hypothetical protein